MPTGDHDVLSTVEAYYQAWTSGDVERALTYVSDDVRCFAPDENVTTKNREGMKIAKAKGRLRGKQPKLNPRQEAHLVELFETGEHSTAELADLFGVGRSTVYRAL